VRQSPIGAKVNASVASFSVAPMGLGVDFWISLPGAYAARLHAAASPRLSKGNSPHRNFYTRNMSY